MPEGYELREAHYMGNSVFLSYESDSGYIYFNYSLADGSSITIDNEKHDYTEITNCSDDSDYSTLIWFDGIYAYSIDAQINQAEFIKIAENIQF